MREACPNGCGWVYDPHDQMFDEEDAFVPCAEHETVCPKNPAVIAKQWGIFAVPGGAVHNVPEGDLVQHALSEDCPCGPTDELVPRADGGDGWMATHHALDGRP